MSDGKPTAQQTLAVLLGASAFRHARKLAQGPAFYNSAAGFQEYLLAADGLNLPSENVIWLFDDSRSSSDQLEDVGEFLESRTEDLKSGGTPPQDLIAYYVGHELFSGPDHTYCLAIRATNERNEGLTSMRVSDLASTIKAHARFLRKFLILDCCFSSTAYKEFLSGPLQVGRIKLLDTLPQKGTTLLCSASAQDPSLAPVGLTRTMFSHGLLKVLRQGHSSLGPRLSLSELGDLVKLNLEAEFPDQWVRPEVHSPDQREGDIANIHLFPNAAFTAMKADATQRMAEVERAKAEAAARERSEADRRANEADEAQRMAEAERAKAEAATREPAKAAHTSPSQGIIIPRSGRRRSGWITPMAIAAAAVGIVAIVWYAVGPPRSSPKSLPTIGQAPIASQSAPATPSTKAAPPPGAANVCVDVPFTDTAKFPPVTTTKRICE